MPISTVERIVEQVRRTQHKRYPPEIFKLSFRSHGSDWRYPREWS
jgi:NAD+ synthase